MKNYGRLKMKNKELGLPYSEDGMEKVAICFDVDGTLIDGEGTYTLMSTMISVFAAQKWKNVDVIVWSGGGKDYARTITERVVPITENIKYHSKLEHLELRKKYAKIIAIDDIQDTRLGDVNLIVRNK